MIRWAAERTVQFEFHYRTYRTFGPNATLHLAARWAEAHLSRSYGSRIDTVLTEACCRSLSPPRATLERLNGEFEEWRRTLPFADFIDNGKTLRLCYAAIYPTQEEVKRDNQVLSLKTFQQALAKAAQLVGQAPELLPSIGDIDCATLASDIRNLAQRAPSDLAALAALYLRHSESAG